MLPKYALLWGYYDPNYKNYLLGLRGVNWGDDSTGSYAKPAGFHVPEHLELCYYSILEVTQGFVHHPEPQTLNLPKP